MTNWYANYIPTWVNRLWQPPRRLNPYRSIRPASESKQLIK